MKGIVLAEDPVQDCIQSPKGEQAVAAHLQQTDGILSYLCTYVSRN